MKAKANGSSPAARRLAAAVLIALCTLGAGRAAADPPSPEAIVAVLGELRSELEWPGLSVREAAANLKTPPEAFRFVRDDILLVNYRGCYAGPEAVLRTRVANATDKSVLLAALLEKMGVQARLARSDWPEQARPHQGPGPRRALPALKKLTALLGPAAGGAAAPSEALSDKQLQELRDEISASAKAIDNLLAAPGQADRLKGSPDSRDTEPTRQETDWVWVQVQADGKTWTDMDAVFPDRPRPDGYQQPFVPKPVTITVRLEAGQSGKEKTQTVLKWSGPCQQVLGHDLLLSYFPAGQDIRAAEQPEKVASWKPFLTCGPLHVTGEAFSPSGGPAKDAPAAAQPAPGGGGFGGLLGPAAPPPPKPVQAGCDFLRLVIEFGDPGGPRPWSGSWSRIVQYVGAGYDPYALIAVHRVGLGMAFIPPRVVEARMADEVLDAYHLRKLSEKGQAAKADAPRGLSTRTTGVLNTMFFLKVLTAPPRLALGWKGPVVFVETCHLRKAEGQLYFVARLDTLHEAFGPQADWSRRQRILWGLATGAAEGRLMKSKSVNQDLLAAAGGLRVIDKSGKPLPGDLDAAAVQRSVLTEGGWLLAGGDAPTCLWAIRPTGDLLGVYMDPRSGVSAKGAGVMTRSQAAGNLFAALGEGAMAATACPAGMLITPLYCYFEELAKAYEAAASVLDGLAETIETGDDSHMRQDKDKYFQSLGARLTNALTRGFVRAWAEGAAGAGIGHVLGTSGSLRAIDRAIDGLVAAGLSLPDETPVFPSLMARVMDAVAVPTE